MWNISDDPNQQIATLNLTDTSDLAASVAGLFAGQDEIGYSGVIVSNDESCAVGVDVESSCYAKGGFVFLFKSYDPDVETPAVPRDTLSTILSRLGQSYLRHVAGESEAEAQLDVAWAVCQRSGDYGTMHNHVPPGGSAEDRYSGMLYLRTPACITPASFPNGCLHIVVDNKAHYFPPIPGTVVIWPSWMMHGIHPFRGLGDRIGIAFDFVK